MAVDEAWLRLAEAVGLSREQVISEELVLPGVRFAVDAYVNFARRASWREAASSSLTELFAPQIHQSRLESWPQHYPWIDDKGYEYFRSRLSQARRDVEHGLTITLDSLLLMNNNKECWKYYSLNWIFYGAFWML